MDTNAIRDLVFSTPETHFNQLNEQVFSKLKSEFLQKKQEKVRMKAMEIIKDVFIPFIFAGLEKSPNDDLEIFLNDIVLELFEKMRDIYCVYDSLTIINDQLLTGGLNFPNFFTQSLVTKLIMSISSPNLHVPQYNFKTRN